MTATFPFLTAYDPQGTGEGSLDPLGLYQIADQLAVQLVPGVRERMQRIRFLVAMAVSALVRQDLDLEPRQSDTSDYLVWEWLVVEAIARSLGDDPPWGVPGINVTRRAIDRYGYVDARSYLKTPRIFGFHGVYKRLATRLGIVDVDLGPGPHAEPIADVWASGQRFGNLDGARPVLSEWAVGLHRSLVERPPRTKPRWNSAQWERLARAFAPSRFGGREKRYLRDLLLSADGRDPGAFPALWGLQTELDDDEFREEYLHERLKTIAPEFSSLLDAIRLYESFARSLQDAFDLLLAEAARCDIRGYAIPDIALDPDFRRSMEGLHTRFEAAHRALGEVSCASFSLPNLFAKRFARFGEPIELPVCALALCEHHEAIQKDKGGEGKRPWFDRLGQNRIYVRHGYRKPRREIQPHSYLHTYRGRAIRDFHRDLS